MNSTGIPLYQFWAKTTSDDKLGLSVRDHCLYVGYVAQALLERLPVHVRGMLPPGIVSLIALHDVGKISPGFQLKCKSWETLIGSGLLARDWRFADTFHAAVSHAIIGSWLGLDRAGYAVAAGGHHGKLPVYTDIPEIGTHGRNEHAELEDPLFAGPRNELRKIIEETLGLLPDVPLDDTNEVLIAVLTGMMTFADWLGSNESFYKTDASKFTNPLALSEVRDLGQKTADTVMDWLKWGSTSVRSGLSFEQLFSFEPNATQTALCELMTRPGLFVVEAPMGIGKTEAALAAAYHRWTHGDERGLYFALPTQLSSERILDRVEMFLSRALDRPDMLALVHSNSWLREDRQVLEVRPAQNDDESIQYAREARQWFASNRQALLASFGGGTVDQALLSVLPVKHCGLRLFGLGGRVVILDEIHSYDRYTGTLVEKLVADVLQLGTTVIVLTATLTAEYKRQLLLAAGVTDERMPQMSPDDAYPMITCAYSDGVPITKAPSFDSPRKEVVIDHRTNGDVRVWTEAASAASAGARVVVVRNTIRLAQDTYRFLIALSADAEFEIGLLHSQFTRWRRDKLEAKWIPALGKENSIRPKGCILVSTQIVEQSLDIDSDLLITDLAPTELIFQRMGRLHRHDLERPEGYREPRTIILHPAIADAMSAKEMRDVLGPSGRVYPPYTLYRAQRHWTQYLKVSLPDDIRPWIEATYSPIVNLPTSVQELMVQWQEKRNQLNETANVRSIRLNHEAVDDEELFTRWEAYPTNNLVLLAEKPQNWKWTLIDGQTINVPREGWNFKAAKALYLNTVRVPAYAVLGWYRHNPSWIRDYMHDAVIGVVDEIEQIRALGPVEDPQDLSWTAEYGVVIRSADG